MCVIHRKIFEFFACREIDGVSYLVADYSTQCYTPEWHSFFYYAVCMVLVYPVAIPIVFYLLLWHNYKHKRLRHKGVRKSLGVIYGAYTTRFWYFEIVDMIVRLFMQSILTTFIMVEFQTRVGTVAIGLYLMLIVYQDPFIRRADDRLAQVIVSLCFECVSEVLESG